MTLLLRSWRSGGRNLAVLVVNHLAGPVKNRNACNRLNATCPNYLFCPSTSLSTCSDLKAQTRPWRSVNNTSDSDFGSVPNPTSENVITIPLHLKRRLDKKVIRESTKGFKRQQIIEASRQGKKTQIIIQCKHPKLNHYFGQTYAKNSEEIPLASKGWGHYKSAGDWFIIKPTTNSVESAFGPNSSTFEELGVKPAIIEKLTENNALKPTLVQELAIPEILSGTNNLVAAETGCGKTLAYLIPAVQQILLEKRLRRRRGVNQPLVIILVPSRELAEQINYVATKLTEGMDIDISFLQGGNLGSKISNPANKDVDLLISTVNVASVLTSAGIYNLGKVQHVILDEADTLLDDSFSEDVLNFLRKFPLYPTNDHDHNTVQLSLVSATLPRSIETTLADVMPVETLNRIATPGLHHVMSHVPQTFIRMKKSLKPEKVLEIVKSDLDNKIPVMIFCNQTKTCYWMYNFFVQHQIKCVKVHGEMRPQARKGLLNMYQNGDVDVLICTDLGSRGIDTVRTKHVLNYEFPMFLADYIHRCGRTGRVGAGKGGHVTSFVSRPFEFETVQEIERSVRRELSLSKVNANIKRLLKTRYGMNEQIVPVDEES